MEKDLANARTLAGMLEEEAAKLRKTKILELESSKAGTEDEPMEENHEDNTEEDEEEPAERGSDAVDRRIEKIMAELRDQGIVDASDETAYENKKVRVLVPPLPH